MTQDAPDRATREPSTGGKRLVLVVQGIGDEEPGATVGSLARSMATATGRSRSTEEEVLWLPEGPGRQITHFPCHVERLRAEGTETVLAEVYWADLSRPGHGVLDLLLAAFRALFGLHQTAARYAADPADRQGSPQDRAAEALQKLSLVCAYLVRGPAAAASLQFACLTGLTVVARALGPAANPSSEAGWVIGIYLATNVASCAAGVWGFRRRRGGPFRELFLWLAVFGVSGVLSWLVRLAGFSAPADAARLGETWSLSALLWSWPRYIAFLLTTLATLPWLVARFRADLDRRPGIDIAQALNVAVLGSWWLIVQFLSLVIFDYLPNDWIPPEFGELATWFSAYLPFYAVFALIPVVALLMTMTRKALWARNNRAASAWPGRPAPRLALGRGIVGSLIPLPVLLFGIQFVPSVRELLGRFFGAAREASDFIVQVAVLIAGVAIYASEHVRTLLDFGLDIVTYFETERARDDGRLVFASRERIQDRLRIVLDALVRRERPDQLTVLAHSLGTIVAIETLAEDRAEAPLELPARTDLVTMASPFRHLLQHYLSNEYPPLGDPRWDGLRRQVDRWYNIFRIDDPVGTDIEPGGEWPENCPVDPGGHTGYWRDRQVLQILHDRQLV